MHKVTKRADGRYVCRYEDKYFYGKTKAQVIKKYDEYVERLSQGCDVKEHVDVQFMKYSREWLDTYRTECNPKAKRQYETALICFGKAVKKKFIKDITASDVQRVYNSLAGKSESYIHKFAMTINAVFKSAYQDGIIQRNPAEKAKPPKGQVGEHRVLEPWERKLITSTYKGHDFGLCAMVMMFAGLRRGEALYLDVDRDVDFDKHTITIRGSVSFSHGNQPTITAGKTHAAQRVIPLSDRLAKMLAGHHGLLCTKEGGGVMSQISFDRKYESYLSYLAQQYNGCQKRWYGRTKQHRQMIHDGTLPEWRDINIRCHDFRVTFCTMCYEAGVLIKTLQSWMGHADTKMIMDTYAKLTKEKESVDADSLNNYFRDAFK